MLKNIKIIGVQFSFLLIWFTVIRLAFFGLYFHLFENHAFIDIFNAFLLGFKFDLSVISFFYGLINLPLFLPFSFFRGKIYLRFTSYLGLFVLLALFYIQTVDLGFYGSINRRLGHELMALGNDIPQMAKTAFLEEKFASIVYLIFNVLLGWLWLKTWKKFILTDSKKEKEKRFSMLMPLYGFVYLLLMAIFTRGGFQPRPMLIGDAFRSPQIELGHLSLNAPFSSLRHLEEPAGKEYNFLPSEESKRIVREMLSESTTVYPEDDYTFFRKEKTASEEPKKKNVVMLIIESLTYKMLEEKEKPYLPFVSDFRHRSLNFTNFFASGTRSIEGMVSILYGITTNPDFQLGFSPYEQNYTIALPTVYNHFGYDTTFLFGIFDNSFHMHHLAGSTGFKKIIRKEDFPNSEDISDSIWGVWDGNALERLIEEADQNTKPFFITFFSVTTHSPWEVPDPKADYNLWKNEDELWKNTFRYTDRALENFFENVKDKPWYKDTIFILTADHALNYESLFRSNSAQSERIKIPFMIFDPSGELKPMDNEIISSQVDILPTLLEIHGFDINHNSMGKSMLGSSKNSFALNISGSEARFITKEKALLALFDRPLQVFDLISDPKMNNPAEYTESEENKELLKKYLSYLQESNNSVIFNKLAPYSYHRGIRGTE